MKLLTCIKGIFSIVLFFGVTQFSYVGNTSASPLIFSEIQNYVDQAGVPKLETAYHKLKVASDTHENYYVRSQLHLLLGWIEDEYAVSTLKFENSNVIRGDNKRFVLSDGTTFTQEESTIKQPSSPVTTPTVIKESVEQEPVEELPTNTQQPALPPNIYTMSNATIDITQVQLARQGRVNDLRVERGLYPMTFDLVLHKTGADRADTIRKKQSADHRRFSNSAYYDYGQLVTWFDDRGVTFKNVSRATFTENIGWAGFYCDSGDCTEEAIISLKRTFDYFRNEEGQAYDVHRRTMIHPLFRVMGIGISVDEPDKKIYIAIHYGTEVE